MPVLDLEQVIIMLRAKGIDTFEVEEYLEEIISSNALEQPPKAQ